MTKILQTTKYNQFKVIKGNRNINRKYLAKLAEAIKEDNMLEHNPIMVNQDMKVLDGQHRLKSAEMIGVPIYYVVVPTGGLREVQMLNTNVRRWTNDDFLESYIAIGKDEYITLRDFARSFDLTTASAVLMLSGAMLTGRKRGQVVEDFRNGDFKVTNMEWSIDFMRKLSDIVKYTEEEAWKDREFLTALVRVYKTIPHDKLLEKLEQSNVRIPRHISSKGYIREFEDVLSFKKKTITRV